jgi:aerobic-type carbon monoxide dehydrogenase small subunit (CoxS/CutS family)
MPEIPEKVKESKSTISRREFLKDAGLMVGGATVGSMALINACKGTTTVTSPGVTSTKTVTNAVTSTVSGPGATVTTTVTQPGGTGVVTKTVPGPTITNVVEPVSTGAKKVKLNVNGSVYEVLVEPEETLRVTLREKLGCLSVKDMCVGIGACGSCTVIMEGRPILSCMALSIECGGKKIETSEGIALAKHPLIESLIMNYAMQCGYCTPGFVCTEKALIDHNPNPTEADIREALAGNLCRCATYIQHIPAVLQAAELVRNPPPPPTTTTTTAPATTKVI